MQLYLMHRDAIKFSHSSMTLIIEFASLQTVATTLGFVGFIINFDRIFATDNYFWLLICLGLLTSLIILLIPLGLIFIPKTMTSVTNAICGFLMKFKFFRKRISTEKINEYLSEYHMSVNYLKEKPLILVKTVLTTLVQMLSFYSVIYFVCLALGIGETSWLSVSSLQAVFSVGLSFVPLPGVVGVTEYGFLLMFASIFPKGLVEPVLILTRTISFYFLLIISGLFFGFAQLFAYIRERKQMSEVS